MKVTPSSPFETSCGLWVLPVRGVTTECRTRRVKSPARLRSAGFFNEDFNIGSTNMIRPVRFAYYDSTGMIGPVRFGQSDGNAVDCYIIGFVLSSL